MSDGRGKLQHLLSRDTMGMNAEVSEAKEFMRVEYALGVPTSAATSTTAQPAAVTIGTFDGVHRGHRAVLARTAERAHSLGIAALGVTFWPHPLAVLRPDDAPLLLMALEDRLALLGSLNLLDRVVVLPFTEALALERPEAFLDRLQGFCALRVLIEGADFAVGNQRAGDMDFLERAGAQRGFSVERVPDEHEAGDSGDSGARISSTRIRSLVQAGSISEATRLLGRPYTLRGEVVPGDKRGRLLGFPTANLRIDARVVLPARGVYAVRAYLPGEVSEASATGNGGTPQVPGHLAVCNIGVRPTFGGEPRILVEVHLLDASLDLYGLPLVIEFVQRLRDERRFEGVDALKAQIAVDAAQARSALAGA